MSNETVKIPDIGGGDGVEVIEICVAVGDTVAAEDSLVVLESDKASMEVPAPFAGKVVEILVKEGDQVSEGSDLMVVATEAAEDQPDTEEQAPAAEAEAADKIEDQPAEDSPPQSVVADEPAQGAAAEAGAATQEQVAVPDIGADSAEVIELCVAAGDEVAEGDSLIVLETDKASMEVPSPLAGKVLSLSIQVGDQASQGTPILELEVQAKSQAPAKPAAASPAPHAPAAPAASGVTAPQPELPTPLQTSASDSDGEKDSVYAGPAVRRLAREFGVSLNDVKGSGPRNRILKEDLQNYVKSRLAGKSSTSVSSGSGIPPVPEVDFSKFGEIEARPLTGMEKATAVNMHRSWVNVPHVTQFDEADISDLEDFRAAMKAEAEVKGVKLTPMPFLLKACAAALRDVPRFNASVQNGEWVQKHYIHIGMAVDTPAGLLVPVIRDVDKKSVWELSAEIAELAEKAKNRKLKPSEMQGGCFTISSLGNIGGTGFTPIVNAPELGILGVSKMAVKPVWSGSEFTPRKMLPLCLSYDHRGINGGDAGRFMTHLVAVLGDVRRLLL